MTQFKEIPAEKSFEVHAFLVPSGTERRVVEYGRGEIVFSQGVPAASVLYIQDGCVRLTVANGAGKEAVLAILGRGEFFGEECVSGQLQRLNTAATITPSRILVIQKAEMIAVLRAQPALSDLFIKSLVSRNIRLEENLTDQLLNSAERRLARALLLLARFGAPGQAKQTLPRVSQELLAEMIGTTRPRVNFLMNRFRKQGFIDYDDEIHVNKVLRGVVLHG